MCASPLSFLRNGPPPPRVAYLPDSLFYVRSVPVSPDVTAESVAGEVELALEAQAPFPLAQLYYGYYWVPGSGNALAYAAYRRRFTVEQTDLWNGADLVIPSFAAFLGLSPGPATTLVLTAVDGVTAVHWDSGPVPSQVLFRPLMPEASDEDRLAAKTELLRALGGTKATIEALSPPVAQSRRTDREAAFVSGEVKSVIGKAALEAADVRDRDELRLLRRAYARDVILWRIAVGTCIAFLALAAGEVLLIGGQVWQKARLLTLNAQKGVVERVMTEQELANRIDDLSTKRLLPLEMLSVVAEKKPAEIVFLRATTTGLYTLQVEAQTSNAGEIRSYQTALEQNPACQKVDVRDPRTRDNVATFTLVVTFKPELLKPAAAPTT